MVEKYRGKIDGFIGENRFKEKEVDDLTRRLMQLNREVKIEKYCQVSCNQRIKRNIFFSFLLFLDYPDKFPNENHDTSI
jgi:hypothetical protein